MPTQWKAQNIGFPHNKISTIKLIVSVNDIHQYNKYFLLDLTYK